MNLTGRKVALAVGFICLFILVSLPLGADEFSFHEVGARAAALGGAFTARADDISALFYNPAGLAFLEGFRFKTNLRFGKRSMTAAWPDGGPTYRSAPNEIGGAHSISWQPFKGVALGVGIFSPYNFEAVWPKGWSAAPGSRSSRINSLYLRSALAVELFKGFAVSAGLDIVSSSLDWSHDLLFNLETNPLTEDVIVESLHSLSGHGTGFVAGALWKVVPAVQVGARYQHSVTIDYSGTDVFRLGGGTMYTWVPGPEGELIRLYELLDLFFVPQDVTGRQTLPREIVCGIALTPFPSLSLYADVQWERGSEFGDFSFRSVNEGGDLSPEFPEVYEEFYGITPDYGIQGVALPLKDTKQIKVGLEFRPGRYLAARAGFASHETALDAANITPVYPDLRRSVYSLGLGYDGPVFSIWDEEERVSDLSFDLFVRYSSAARVESVLPGFEMTYGSNRFILGVGVGFCF